jgi:DnaK suppressor protein
MRTKTSDTTSRKPNFRGVVQSRASVAPHRQAGLARGCSPYEAGEHEEYMSAAQLEHFRRILLAWKRELLEEVDRTVRHMQEDAGCVPDMNDRASQEAEFDLELRARDRERKLLKKIDLALKRIDEGTYGYCEETGEEIGLRRLEARPIATLCIEAQERRELGQRQSRYEENHFR